jgi:hypothetical protein
VITRPVQRGPHNPVEVRIGDRVTVVFDRVSHTQAVPRFTPVG